MSGVARPQLTVQFDADLQAPWTTVDVIALGQEADSVSIGYANLLLDGLPWLRVDLHAPRCHHGAFRDAVAWGPFVVMGYGESIHLIDTRDRRVITHALTAYFGHFYGAGEYGLVASGERLHCLRANGSLAWISDVLGIDGVTVDAMDETTVQGAGEWDPPGGWRRYVLSLATGESVAGHV